MTRKSVRINGFCCPTQLKLGVSEVSPRLTLSVLITNGSVQIAGTDKSANRFADSPSRLPLPQPIAEVVPRLGFTYLVPNSVGRLLSQPAYGDQVVETPP